MWFNKWRTRLAGISRYNTFLLSAFMYFILNKTQNERSDVKSIDILSDHKIFVAINYRIGIFLL